MERFKGALSIGQSIWSHGNEWVVEKVKSLVDTPMVWCSCKALDKSRWIVTDDIMQHPNGTLIITDNPYDKHNVSEQLSFDDRGRATYVRNTIPVIDNLPIPGVLNKKDGSVYSGDVVTLKGNMVEGAQVTYITEKQWDEYLYYKGFCKEGERPEICGCIMATYIAGPGYYYLAGTDPETLCDMWKPVGKLLNYKAM